MNYVNFNNFQPLNETVYTREEAKTAILMVETKNVAKANQLVANLSEEGNDMKSILGLVENKLDMVSALASAKELLERNAFLGALAKAREAKSKTFEFNGKEYEVFGAADVSEEEVVEEAFGKPAGLSKDETMEVAQRFADAISKVDGKKVTVDTKTLEEDSFDLNIDGKRFDGGSYNIYRNGDVVNMALPENPIYGRKNDSVDTIVKNMKKMSESKVNEALSSEQKMVETFLKKVAKEFDFSIQDAARFVKETISKMGLNESKVNESSTISIPKLSDINHTRIIKWMSNQFDDNTWDMKKSGSGFEITIDKLSKAEQKDLMAYLKSQDYINEAADHEVGMAKGQLLDIAKNASELMTKIGETEKDIPGWIQDHISQSQNYINQANSNYHELEESTELDEAKKYDLGFGSLGSGTTVWNRAKEVHGDYETVAHISVGGNITYYDKKMPEDVKKQIEDMAANESNVTEKDEAVFIEFLNKDKNFKKDTKHFKSYDKAVKWAKANFDKFSPDMIKYESLEINEKNEVTVSLRHAVQANDIFDDMYKKIGKKEYTDTFSFKSKADANDFIESLIMVGVPEDEID